MSAARGAQLAAAVRLGALSEEIAHPLDLDLLVRLDVPRQGVGLGLEASPGRVEPPDHRDRARVVADHVAQEQPLERAALRPLEPNKLGLREHARHPTAYLAACSVHSSETPLRAYSARSSNSSPIRQRSLIVPETSVIARACLKRPCGAADASPTTGTRSRCLSSAQSDVGVSTRSV